jgi:hypothetical protein
MQRRAFSKSFCCVRKSILKWPRKEILFSDIRASRNLCNFLILLLHVPLLICIKFMNKNNHLLFVDSLKADISGQVIAWLELMGLQDKEVRICQTGSMISLKDCLLEA